MNIKDSVQRYSAKKVIDYSFKRLHRDPQKALLTTLSFFRDLHVFEDWKFQMAEKKIRDDDGKWMAFITDILEKTDEHILKTTLLNVGYQAAFAGTRYQRQLRKELGTNLPWTILFDPTSACNLSCVGCWSAEYGHEENLSYEEMRSIILQGRELGVYFYLLTGGEPLVRKKDLAKIFREFDDCGFHLFTNGTLIDEDFCDLLKEVGNVTLSISIEGFEEANDARRGEGSFSRIVEAMELMKEKKILFGGSICYTKENYKEVTSDAFLDFLIEQGVRLVWYFHYMPVGSGAHPDLLLDPDAREYMIRRIRYLRSDACKKPIMTIDFQNDGQYIGGCIAGGKDYLHINAAGDVEPCVFIHYSTANIRDVSIKEALAQPLFMAYKEAQPFNDNHFRPCPMLENPEFLEQMVQETGAKNTSLMEKETATELCAKCVDYAEKWKPRADVLWEEFKFTEEDRKTDSLNH